MKTCSAAQYEQYLSTFFAPELGDTEMVADGAVGIIRLPVDVFAYNSEGAYEFDVACVCEENSHRKLLFVRINTFDPAERKKEEPEYCIPIAYEGASERDRLTWTIGFGGMWSDSWEEVIAVFDERWKPWFGSIDGVAFTNGDSETAAFLEFTDRELEPVEQFCGE